MPTIQGSPQAATVAVLAVVLTAVFALWQLQPSSHPALPDRPDTTSVHYPAFSKDLSFYEEAWEKTNSTAPTEEKIKGLIVSHHLLARALTAKAFRRASSDSIQTVILLAPDHYGHNQTPLVTTDFDFTTPYGTLKTDSELLSKLKTRTALIRTDPSMVDQEHGLGNVTAFIKKAFPNAKLSAFMVAAKINAQDLHRLAALLSNACGQDCILLGSFDFSHYLPKPAADFHDRVSLDAIQSFNYSLIEKLDVDSPSGLALFLKILETQEFTKASLSNQDNSDSFSPTPQLETTSYLFLEFTKGQPLPTQTDSALVLGSLNQSSLETMHHQSPKFAYKYLERLWLGQRLTYSLTIPKDAQWKNFLSRFGLINLPEEQQEMVKLGKVDIEISPKLNCDENTAQIRICTAEKNAIMQTNSNQITFGLSELNPDPKAEDTTTSLALGLLTNDNDLYIHLLPIVCQNSQCALAYGSNRDIILSKVAEESLVLAETKKQIQTGIILIQTPDK